MPSWFMLNWDVVEKVIVLMVTRNSKLAKMLTAWAAGSWSKNCNTIFHLIMSTSCLHQVIFLSALPINWVELNPHE